MMVLAGLFGATAVLAGAFGAHALKSVLSEGALETWGTASQYHLLHAVALLALATWVRNIPRLVRAFRLMASGTVLFSGSLYVLVLTGMGGIGWITPLGGILLVAAWLDIAWSAFRFDRARGS